DPAALEPKFDATTRPSDGLAIHMILIATAQELRAALPSETPRLSSFIDGQADVIIGRFMKPDLRAVLEQVGPTGDFNGDHFEGRMLNPGHAMEAAWFLLREARERGGDARLRSAGLEILDWMWDWGWDREYGGIIYFRDALGLPGVEYWHDMKFWWPQNEAAIATLMAYADTGDSLWAERFDQIWEWADAHFPDRSFGEWFGYLHRDGSVSTELKGNLYKGPFHLPRMHLVCLRLVEELLKRGAGGLR
ncbi:MAG: AGE family epimerase/isomerase, partial [Spirochaetes bacterium]|nr:AGE family epimerase/isomerase [Spirochaetota bacterium]